VKASFALAVETLEAFAAAAETAATATPAAHPCPARLGSHGHAKTNDESRKNRSFH
jgi:hypothetical protein